MAKQKLHMTIYTMIGRNIKGAARGVIANNTQEMPCVIRIIQYTGNHVQQVIFKRELFAIVSF